MARRINRLQINALNQSNNRILTVAGGDLVYEQIGNILIAGPGIAIESNGRISSTASAVADTANFANVANTVLYISNFSADDLTEGNVNLYYSNDRVASYIEENITTSNVAEGDNLYYTNARVQAYVDTLDLSANLSANTSDDLPEGLTNLYYSNDRVAAYLAETDLTVQDFTVGGNLVVNGTTTTLNTATLVVEDKNITLANGAVDANSADGAGINVDGAQANITYDATSDKWQVNKTLQVNGYDVLTKELTDATFEPTGHEARLDSTISFDPSTRTFSISPANVSYDVWVKGNKFVKSDTETVTIANTTGLHYIYFNTSGNIASRMSYFDWENDAPTAYIYWNANTAVAPFFADERHGVALDWQTHEYLHRTRGAAIAEGFGITYTLGDGSSDSHAQIEIDNGTFFDEDLQVTIEHSATPTANTWEQVLQGPAQIPVFYLSGQDWRIDAPTNFPAKQGSSRVKYNLLSGGAWTTPDVPTDGYYTSSWIIATNNLDYPILAIMGQSATETVGAQESVNFQNLVLTNFPVIEFRPLYKVIWSTDTGYTTTINAKIQKVYDLRNVVSASPTGVLASDHGLLSGLGDDDHTQYVHTEIARNITANHTFDGTQNFANISATGEISANSFVSSGVGTPTLSSVLNINLSANGDNGGAVVISDSPLRLKDYTTTDRGNISASEGDVIYNTTDDKIEFYTGTAWISLGAVPALSDAANIANYANIANIVESLSNFSTDDLNEGNVNFYYTNARVQAYLDDANVLANITFSLDDYTTDDLNEGTSNLYYSNDRVQAYLDFLGIEAGGNITANLNLGEFTTDDLGEGTSNLYYTNLRVAAFLSSNDSTIQSLTVTSDLVVGGDLTVQGNTVTLNTTTLTIEDKNITLANGAANASLADGSGITIAGASANIIYDAVDDRFEINKDLLVESNITIGTALGGSITGANVISSNIFIGNLTGTVSSIANHTTTDLAEGDNLYYTNARVLAYVNENLQISAGANLAANTTTDLVEGDNLYYTNARTRSAFTAGRGITISQLGSISADDDSPDFSLFVDGGSGAIVTDTLSNVLVFTSETVNNRYKLISVQVTNIFDEDITLSGNMLLGGNAITFANHVPIPVGGSIEFLKRPQAFINNDAISMIGYYANGTPAANVAAASFTYETVSDIPGLFSTGTIVSAGNVDTLLYSFEGPAGVLESIKIVNLDDVETPKVRVIWTDANNNPISYFSYNTEIPTNTSVEVLSSIKRINASEKIFVRTNSNARVSAIISGRLSETVVAEITPLNIPAGTSSNLVFSTTLEDGTIIHYTFNPI